MILILVRHAHRDTADRRLDNGLSPKGRRQAKRLRDFYKARFGKERPLLLSSPSRRCLETLFPLARLTNAKTAPSPILAERGPAESAAHFHQRIKMFLRSWKTDGAPLTVVCSHGDWVPLALREAAGARATLKKGGWAELLREGRSTTVAWLVQCFAKTIND